MDKPIKCRMRTIKDTAKFFKEMDSDTEITEFALRHMIKNGTIPTVKTGNKYLINLDVLLKIFGVETDA